MKNKRNIIIVAESGADLSDEDIQKYGIFIVSMYVTMNGKTRFDGSFPVQELYTSYEATGKLPQTSAPNPEDYAEVFHYIHDRWPEAEILHLCYSAVTSCSYQNAVLASEGLPYVIHVDSKNVTAGQAGLILKTARYIETHPEITAQELIPVVENWIEKSCMVFVPGDLEYLKAGGRVSNAAYLGASILSLKPLIEILDGKLVSTRKYRGKMHKVIPKVIDDFFEKYIPEKEEITVLYSKGFEFAQDEMIEKILKERGIQKVSWLETGTVITTHCGPGAFGLAAFSA